MYFEELEIGMQKTLAPVVIDKEEMMSFARRYDNVPIHTDEAYAKTTNFGDVIAPGVMSFMTVWAKYLEDDFFGTELIAGLSTKIEWFRPVYAGDTLTGTAVITNLTPRNKWNGLVELTIEITNQDGIKVIRDTTETVLKRKQTD